MEIHDLTALEQGAAIRTGEVSSRELVEHYLARIEKYDATLGAFITVTGSQARERASSVDVEGPLAGVPTAIKDLTATAGVRTTYGSRIFEEFVPDHSDEVVLRMEAAGLVTLGKTNTPEFGTPCYTEPDVAPPAVTPWDLTRTAGGSSGGAGAAVAGGLVPFAHGSDGAGSIRIPASCCGVVGLKPSRGRISGAPLFGEVTGLATSGPLARTVRDTAALLDVMSGPALGEPTWAAPPEESFLAACDRPPGRLRIGVLVEPVLSDAPVAPECLAAVREATSLLEQLGHHVEEIERPMDRQDVRGFAPVWDVLAALSTFRLDPEQRALLRPVTRWLAEQGERFSAPQFAAALSELRQAGARTLARIAAYDLVLTPTLAQLPAPVGSLRNDDDPAADFRAQGAFTPWTSMWNVTGSPAISLPLHWTTEGLPVGVMLAAKPTREELLLAVSAQLEEAAPWRHRTPECWAQ